MHGVWRGAVSAGHEGHAHRGEKEVVVGWRDQSVTYEAPGADLAARGEFALIINGVTVCVPGDRGGHMGAAIVGVALPLGYASLTGALCWQQATVTFAGTPAASFVHLHRTLCSMWN